MIKILFKEIKEYKFATLMAPFFMILEVVMELMIPFLMSIIIDKGLENGDIKIIFLYGSLMFLVAVLSLIFGAISGNFAAYASTGFVKNLRASMFKNIMNFSFSNIDKYSTSGLVTRMMTDATNVQNAFQMIIRMGVRAPLMLLIAMGMSFYINSELAFTFIYAALFLGICLGFIIFKAYPMFDQTFKKYDDLNASIQENVTNIRVVKAYVKEDHEISKFEKAALNIRTLFSKAENILVYNSPIMQLTMYSCLIALSWFGAKMIVYGDMKTGQLMNMFTYTMNILVSLMMISMIFVMITMSLASAKRIAELLKEESDIKNCLEPVYEMKDGSIKFENVNFGYYEGEDKYILTDINLDIKNGETIGIIGGTGSSKSTLVNLICRLYDVNSGSIKIGGVDVKNYDLDTLRNNVAVVLQKNVLFSGTIAENLRWGNESATDEQLKAACQLSCADEFIQQFPDKYNTIIEQGGANVSGGQKQRICIARALLKNPKILILDDSTSAVDTKTDTNIRFAFKNKIPNMTKIIIAQRITSLEDADRIIVLNEGKIDGIGTHEQLLNNNKIYQEVYNTQKQGGEDNE